MSVMDTLGSIGVTIAVILVVLLGLAATAACIYYLVDWWVERHTTQLSIDEVTREARRQIDEIARRTQAAMIAEAVRRARQQRGGGPS